MIRRGFPDSESRQDLIELAREGSTPHRLERRAEDSPDVIAHRLKNAAAEIPHWNEYDYVLVNRDLDKSFMRLRAILTAERLKRVNKPNLTSFVGELLADLKKIG